MRESLVWTDLIWALDRSQKHTSPFLPLGHSIPPPPGGPSKGLINTCEINKWRTKNRNGTTEHLVTRTLRQPSRIPSSLRFPECVTLSFLFSP